MATDDAAFADRLDRYLDLQAGSSDVSPNGLPVIEPELAETIHRLRALDDAPRANPRFAAHLLEDLMDTTRSLDPTAFHFNSALAPGREGRALSPSLPQRPTPRPRWMPAHLATAALIVFTLVGSIIVLGPGRSWRQPSAPAFLPAISATPATPDAGEVETTSLLDLVIPTIGDDQGFLAINRYTIPPATTLEADMQGGHIPSVFLLVAGELEARAVDAPEPVRVVRSGGADPEEAIASWESVELAAGDAIVIPENGAADLMNLTAEPAVVLFVLQPSYIVIPGSNAIENESLGGSARELRAPLAVSLRQATLEPGATLTGDDAPEVEQFAVPVDPDRIMDARTSANGTLRNAGDEPLEAYVLTVTSGTPTPESEIGSETLLDETVASLPAGHAQVMIYATRLQPGISTEATGQTGTALLKVEQGSVAITGPDGEQSVNSGETVQFSLSSSGAYGLRNIGDTEARSIEVDLLDAEKTLTSTTDGGVFSDPTGGVLDVPLGVGVTLPEGPGRVALERLTVPPGGSLPAYTASGLDWIGIEEGRVGVTLEGERLPFRWDSGEERSFALGQAIPAAAPGVQVTLRNDGDGVLVLLHLTLIPGDAGGSTGTPAPS